MGQIYKQNQCPWCPKLHQSGAPNLVAIYGPLKRPRYKHFFVPNRVVSIESLGQCKPPIYKNIWPTKGAFVWDAKATWSEDWGGRTDFFFIDLWSSPKSLNSRPMRQRILCCMFVHAPVHPYE